jgi:predicted glycosyltransferase
MKRIVFYLAHPAHYHLFKNVINSLKSNNVVFVVYNDKDVLHELIVHSDFKNISHRIKTLTNVNSKSSLLIQFLIKLFGSFFIFLKLRPTIVIGTPILISLLSKILFFKSIIVNEDDFDIIKKTANFGYPFADHILCPSVCRTNKFESKCIKYEGYHELAYLHPNNFQADLNICKKLIDISKPYFIIRFAKLFAHHDDGIKGINNEIALKIVELLKPFGNIYITSEKKLSNKLEKFRINISPKYIHQILAFSSLYIGDSQTMAAESGVLGVPFIRFNDFVGKISYLDELENKYNLGFGILPKDEKLLYKKINEILKLPNRHELFQLRKNLMLNQKIDYSSFLTWFIENYPSSVNIMKNNSNYQFNFKK